MSTRVLVISEDPVGEQMGGNGIRAYELARALSDHAQVTLAAPISGKPVEGVDHVPFDREAPRALKASLRGVDVVLALPQNPVISAQLRRSDACIVYDMYDPKPLQLLEARASEGTFVRRYWSTISLDHAMDALGSADHLLCASERQRDLWIGALLASGLITPAVYDEDPSLRATISVVPFGLPATAPAAVGRGPYERWPALQRDAEIVLWNGGLWNWLDPLCAVQAIAIVLERRPQARLVFMGRPPEDPREAIAARQAAEHARHLGLLDKVVFFNDEWVAYRRRADWLLAASCALSLHVDHLETRFSFRTRLLDCFWAGLPVVCTSGDELAERVQSEQLGAAVPEADPEASARAIVSVLERGRASYGQALASAAADHLWPKVAAPLIDFVNRPDARGRARGRKPLAPGRAARAAATRAARWALRALPPLN